MDEQLAHKGLGTKGYSEWGDIRLETWHWWGSAGSILGPVLLNILINDLGLEGILSKFSDNAKLRGDVESQEDRESPQRDLDKF